jgi:AMP deaminase
MAEQAQQLQALQQCLDLRDKYMLKSRQRLGDDPRDYDGVFPGVDNANAGVSCFRPDMDISANPTPSVQPFEPWKIYPKPPRPQWHPQSKAALNHTEDELGDGFLFEECEIPGEHSWSFKLDDKGVYQVYEVSEGKGELYKCTIIDSTSPLS